MVRNKSPKWQHPGIRRKDQLTRGERAADILRNGMGSWGFVFAAMIFLAGWMLGNRSNGFDPYPFILLNLVLSCLAAMQGAILLIAAKREDQVSSELAEHDYEINKRTEKLVIQLHEHILQTTPQAIEKIDKEIKETGI
ncbi:MAG: DUF1003 domain-containing protein [Acidimicrobiia bacterium]